jgi:hypothetical protein
MIRVFVNLIYLKIKTLALNRNLKTFVISIFLTALKIAGLAVIPVVGLGFSD